MNWLMLAGLSIGLAMDAFAVSTAAAMSLPHMTPRHTFRLAFHFGLFQFLMPVLGWMAGRKLVGTIAAYDHWVAFGLLSLVGGKMLFDAWKGEPHRSRADPTRGLLLVTLSVATSIDALAVGLSMAFLQVPIWIPAIVIGLVAGGLSVVGCLLGKQVGPRCGRWAELAGGCVLLAIGARMLISHLAG